MAVQAIFVPLFICTGLYVIAFKDETWLSGAFFQIACVCAWLYLYCLSRRHSVVDMLPLSIIDSMPAENPLSMQSVADMSGFNSISTFNRSFTKTVGMTPSEYARKRSAS